ncbi:MAG: hypothetical protein JEZ08_02620 [Clostridiales bacterium]|nr:hypothetical protein [Clostridiales bacterium]
MKNFLGLIALVIVEIASFSLFVEVDATSKFGLWAVIYAAIAFNKIINLRNNKMYTGTDNYYVLAADQKADNTQIVKKKSLVEQFNTKLFYLLAALSNAGICYYLIQFS